jgi:hypothetical protein
MGDRGVTDFGGCQSVRRSFFFGNVGLFRFLFLLLFLVLCLELPTFVPRVSDRISELVFLAVRTLLCRGTSSILDLLLSLAFRLLDFESDRLTVGVGEGV